MATLLSPTEPLGSPLSRKASLHSNSSDTGKPREKPSLYFEALTDPPTSSIQDDLEKPSKFHLVDAQPSERLLKEDGKTPGKHHLVVHNGKPAGVETVIKTQGGLPGLGYDVSNMYKATGGIPLGVSRPWESQELEGTPGVLSPIPRSAPVSPIVSRHSAENKEKEKFPEVPQKKAEKPSRLSSAKARIRRGSRSIAIRLSKKETVPAEALKLDPSRHPDFEISQYSELDSTAIPAELATCGPQDRHRYSANFETPQPPITPPPIYELATSANEPSTTVAASTALPDSSYTVRFDFEDNGRSETPRPGTQAPRPLTRHPDEQWFSDAETLTSQTRPGSTVWSDTETRFSPIPTAHARKPSTSSIVRTPTRGLSLAESHRKFENSDNIARPVPNKPQLPLLQTIETTVENAQPTKQTNLAHSPIIRRASKGKGIVKSVSFRERETSDSEPLSEDDAVEDIIAAESSARRSKRPRRVDRKRLRPGQLHSPINISPTEERLRLAQEELDRAQRDHIAASTSGIPSHLGSTHRSLLTIAPGEEAHCSYSPQSPSEVYWEQRSGSINTAELPAPAQVGGIPLPADLEIRPDVPKPPNVAMAFLGSAFMELAATSAPALNWLRQKLLPEPPVPLGHSRVRWKCSCGQELYDDFVEQRSGAVRELTMYLNRQRSHTKSHSPSSPSLSASSTFSSVFSSNMSRASTAGTSYSGSWAAPGRSNSKQGSPTYTRTGSEFSVRIGALSEAQWLLTCANEGRFTPKIQHIDVNEGRVRSDRDLALELRKHYGNLNAKWYKWLKLRGLTTIEFVQFEMHKNRFADIRKCPDVPPVKEDKYSFSRSDLIPPVGSSYLLHLFKHPQDYDDEIITLTRAPKRTERLRQGVGWGIHLKDGFLADRVWSLVISFFALGSLVFAIVWMAKRGDDVQGAFGVAAWMCTFAALVIGWAQAVLD